MSVLLELIVAQVAHLAVKLGAVASASVAAMIGIASVAAAAVALTCFVSEAVAQSLAEFVESATTPQTHLIEMKCPQRPGSLLLV